MVKYIIFFTLIICVNSVYAGDLNASDGVNTFNGITGFFEKSLMFMNSFSNFIFFDIPSKIVQFMAWLGTYIVWIKLLIIQSSLESSHDLAVKLIDSLNMTQVINSAVSNLPPDTRQILIGIRFFDGLQLVIEAYVTRFIYSMF